MNWEAAGIGKVVFSCTGLSMQGYILICSRLKERTFDGTGLSAEGTLTSASAVAYPKAGVLKTTTNWWDLDLHIIDSHYVYQNKLQ